MTNWSQGPTPDQTGSVISLGAWDVNSSISGTAYGFMGDWTAGRTYLLGGTLNGSYNSSTGTFGAATSGTLLDVTKYLSLSPTERQQLGLPGTQEAVTFNLSGSNPALTTVTISTVRTFSNATTDTIKLWASDSVSGAFSTPQLQGERVAISAGTGIQGLFQVEHAGASPGGGDQWLAEINGLGQLFGGTFSSSFYGTAAGTYSAGIFSGTAAGIAQPLTYYSSFTTTNLLKRYDDATTSYQFEGSLLGVFGGISLWGATNLNLSNFEAIGVRSLTAALTKQDYIFTTSLDSMQLDGTATTLDGGAYKGYFAGALVNGLPPEEEPILGQVAALYAAPDGSAGILTGKFNGTLDGSGIWEAHGDWFPIPLISTPAAVNPATLLATNISELSLPLNVAQTGNFQGGGSIATVASIAGNNLDRNWITAYPDWGTFRLTTAGTYSGTTSNQWSYNLAVNSASSIVTGSIAGDTWELTTVPTAGRLHGTLEASWVDMTLTLPKTGILVGETLGTFDPAALTWQAVAAGSWLETAAYLALAGTSEGRATLQKLNIPAFEIGTADLSGSFAGSATVDIAMNGIKFLAPTAGGRPTVWATGTVSGNYSGNPAGVSIPLTQSGGTASGITGNLNLQSFTGGKWGGSLNTSPTGAVGGHTNISLNGMAAGSYTGAGSGTLSGTAAGVVK